jgi:anaerobic selenocysteine-containing dehydrogenase
MRRDVRGACALDCPDTCSWIVTVKDGEAIALRGDPEHPFTRGSLCNKVAGYLGYARSADRLLHPMRRAGPKDSGVFVRISWDEALDEIASRLQDAIAAYGAEAIWPFLGSGSMGLIQGAYSAGHRLWNVLGASRHVQTMCTIAGGCGTGYTLGNNRVGMDPETFRFSRLIVLWGANVLSRLGKVAPSSSRSIRSARELRPPATGTSRPCLVPMPRWRSGCSTSS